MNELENGCLVISLDFELLWGVFDKVNWHEKREYFIATRKVIPKILEVFTKFNIQCTWATVGMLFNENWEEWERNIPDVLPEYNNTKLSAYKYGKSIRSKESEIICFAPDLIKVISQSQGQEVGSHTYSHYYCLEPGQDLQAFIADLQKSKELATKLGIELKSLVFPRNQFNKDYLNVCLIEGLKNIRSNPKSWYWKDTQKNSLTQKIFRTGEAYMGKMDKMYDLSEAEFMNTNIFSQKASRLLRPHSEKKILNKLKLKRILDEITYAARKNKVYHLWWHPHNFGNAPENNMKDLEIILRHFDNCKKKFGMQSSNMANVDLMSK